MFSRVQQLLHGRFQFVCHPRDCAALVGSVGVAEGGGAGMSTATTPQNRRSSPGRSVWNRRSVGGCGRGGRKSVPAARAAGGEEAMMPSSFANGARFPAWEPLPAASRHPPLLGKGFGSKEGPTFGQEVGAVAFGVLS